MKYFFLILYSALSFAATTRAQNIPVGLYEGMMGNSGVAITNSTAASYYNPSLLRQRKDNAFSLNGTSISSVNSKSDGSTFSSSLGIAPSYLSNIIVGEDLVHEFFVANTLQGQFSWKNAGVNSDVEAEANMTKLVSGYSMAFKSIPLALQFLARYSEIKMFGVNQLDDSGTNTHSVTKFKNDFKNLNVALGISSHFQFDYYTLGVNFNTRGWTLYSQDEGQFKTYTPDLANPGSFLITDGNSTRAFINNEEGKLAIGHGFKVGDHEILTDSVFVENSDRLNSYDFAQTFGYRYGDTNGHQLLCGISHNFGQDIDYFGQSFNTSVGYSWTTRKLRSAIGFYYGKESTTLESSTAGILFGSEYEY